MKACIVVPCFNESKRICVQSFLDFLNDNEHITFLFVDDGSTDKTIQILKEMNELSIRAQYIELPKNVGKAEAVRSGVLYAHLQSFTHIGYLDADLTISLATARDLLEVFNNHSRVELTFASRTKRFETKESKNLPRQTIGYIFSFISKRLLQLPITDTQCGAKFFTARVVPVLFNNSFFSRWIFDVEIFFRFKAYFSQSALFYLHEFPIESWEDNAESKIKFIDYLKVPYNLVRIFIHYRVTNHSLYLPYEVSEVRTLE
jgi:dolichyl-phosphate beta-glucosyltransferase